MEVAKVFACEIETKKDVSMNNSHSIFPFSGILQLSFPMKSARILSTSIFGLLTLLSVRTAHGQAISLTGTGGVISQNFNTLNSAVTWQNNITLPGWYANTNTLSDNIPLALFNQGSATASGFFSMGTSGERALGFRPTTGTYTNTAIGVIFRNTTASTMRISQIVYTGEMYTGRDVANLLDGYQFFYQKSATPITSLAPFSAVDGNSFETNASNVDAGWNRLGTLDYAVSSVTAGAIYNPPLVTDIAVSLDTLTLAPNEYITLRWRNPNDANGDAVMGIDNFAISYVVPGSDIVYNRSHTAGGAPNGTLSASATQYWLKNGVASGFTAGDRIIFSQDGSATISVPADVVVDRMTVSANTGTYTIGGAGRIFGDLVKTGTGNLVLTSANSFSTVTLDGGGVISGNAAGAVNAVLFKLQGVGGTLQVTGENSLRKIEGTGTFTKGGTGNLTFGGSDANAYTGMTTIQGGSITAAKPFNVLAIPGDLTVNAGGAFKYAVGNAGQQLRSDATVTLNGGSFGEIAANPPGIGAPETLANVVNNGGTFGTGQALISVTDHYNQVSGLTLIQRGGALTATEVSIGGTLNMEGSSPSARSILTVGANGLALTAATVNFNASTPMGGAQGSTLLLGGNLTSTGDSKLLRGSGGGVANIDLNGVDRDFNVTGTLTLGATNAPIDFINNNGGQFGIFKLGPGTLNLLGAHSTVNLPIGIFEGKVVINSALSTTFLRADGASAVFGGTGTVTMSSGAVEIWEAGINGSGQLSMTRLDLGQATGDNAFVTVTQNGVPASIKVTATNGLRTNSFPGGIIVNLVGATPAVGEYVIIDYEGAVQGTGGAAFALGTLPSRLIASVYDDTTPGVTAIKLKVDGADRPIWTGRVSSEWKLGFVGGNENWKTQALPQDPTDFRVNDQPLFDDTVVGLSGAVQITTADVVTSSVTFNNVNKSYQVYGAFGIAGTGFLTKNGAGTVQMDTVNSFTGGVNLNGGMLKANTIGDIGVNSSLGSAGTIAFAGGTLSYTGDPASTNRLFAFGTGGGTIQVDGAMTITSNLSGTGTLTKTGSGDLILTGDNNVYTGGLTIKGGAVVVTDLVANLASIGGSSQVVTLDGGALKDASTSPTKAFFSTASSIMRSLAIGSGGGSINVVNAAHATVIEAANGISGSGTLTKEGAGALLAWGGTTTFTGHVVVNQGTLEVDSVVDNNNVVTASGIGNGSVEVNGGGTLAGRNTAVKNVVSLVNGKLSTTGGDNTDYRGAVTADGNFTVDLRDYAVPTTSRSLKISGVLGGSGAITVSGNAGSDKALILTGNGNTYGGQFFVDPSQTLLVQPSGAGNPLNTAAVQLTNSTLAMRYDSGSSNGVFSYTSNAISILGTGTSRIDVNRADIDNGVSTGNAFRFGSLTMSGEAGQTLSVVGGNGYRAEIANTTTLNGAVTIQTQSADLVLKGSLSGSAGLTKTGSERLILETNNATFSGNLSVQEGTLVMRNNVSLPNGDVNVSGGRLAGTGTIVNSVLVNSAAGALSPGENGAGLLTIQKNLTMASGSDFEVNLGGNAGTPVAGTTYDQVRVGNGVGAVSNGAVSINGTDLMITINTGISTNNLFFIVVNDGTDVIGGTFAGLIQGQEFTVNGQGLRISYQADASGVGSFSGGNDIALMAVPEPGSVCLLLGGLGLIAGSRRRRAR
jgi:fibronectin-binding autotransporter adhesin